MKSIYNWLVRYEAPLLAGAVVLLVLAVVGSVEMVRL
jgi:hypothetical protein